MLRFGALEQRGDLQFGQAGEVTRVPRLAPGAHRRGQARERGIQAEGFLVQAQAAFDFLGQFGDAVQVAAALLREALARVIDDDAAHRGGGVGKEVRTIVELRGVAADEFQVGLVHQGGRIERCARAGQRAGGGPSHAAPGRASRARDPAHRDPRLGRHPAAR
jgi:hypothetical protein